jgi:cellulose synthase (UDP-forming)
MATATTTPLLLPTPPDDDEKYGYVERLLALLVATSTLSLALLLVSQLHFIMLSPWLLVLVPFLAFTVVYFLIALRVNVGSQDFDLAAHEALVAAWAPKRHPSVDILLPICSEQLAVLQNTWSHVRGLADAYPGEVAVHVLDDGDDPDAAAMATGFGFRYGVRPNRGWLKKAGNLRYGYENSDHEFVVIFDADFAPREDFLAELLPYMDAAPDVGIVQSPQYFRVDRRQTWVERGAGAVQELFYRVVQVSRDRLHGAICVGSCAVYRRAALDTIGGTALIEHSEDVHTGFELTRAGWRLRYVPLPLATGLCPQDADSFLTQQYRWCAGSMSLLGSKKFWQTKIPLSTRLCYLSGFCYYLHTAVFTFVTPVIPILLLLALPGQVHLRNYLWIVPSTMYAFVVFPFWNHARFGPEALMAKAFYGWAHAFAVFDILRRRRMGWQATGAGAKQNIGRIWTAIAVWGGATSVVWIGATLLRMAQYDVLSFAFLLFAGLVYAMTVGMMLRSRTLERAALVPA